MMGKLKRSLRKPVVRTTLLIFGLCSAALYADSHLKADMDLAIENSICHNQRKQMMEHIIVSDSKFKRVSSKLNVYAKLVEGVEYAGLRVIASAIHPRQLVLELALKGQEPDFNLEACKSVLTRFDRILAYVKKEPKFAGDHQRYLAGVVMFERNFFQRACGEAQRDRFL